MKPIILGVFAIIVVLVLGFGGFKLYQSYESQTVVAKPLSEIAPVQQPKTVPKPVVKAQEVVEVEEEEPEESEEDQAVPAEEKLDKDDCERELRNVEEDLESSQDFADLMKKRLEDAQKELDEAKQGTRTEDVEDAEDDVDDAQEDFDEAQTELTRLIKKKNDLKTACKDV